jgi:DNA-binding MarR family transcriptional regulator/GNAT superfamily N-acetyltransferase
MLDIVMDLGNLLLGAGVVAESEFDQRVEAVRSFNRFYTRRIGVLDDRLLRGPFSLAGARVLFELAHRETTTAADLGKALGLDPGYLSRILRGFQGQGLISKTPSRADARQSLLHLNLRGRRAFARIDSDARVEIGRMLAALRSGEQARLVAAMNVIEHLLGSDRSRHEPCLLRQHQPGDMGWVVHRHGVLYAEEYGWDERFEAHVAEIVAHFIENYDPRRERAWIAESGGEIIGSVFVVKQSDKTAKLRLLLVEPRARGAGVGTRLVNECVRFARSAGYRKLTLWTNSVLNAARSLYERTGFRLAHQEPHQLFGHDLVGQTWELTL